MQHCASTANFPDQVPLSRPPNPGLHKIKWFFTFTFHCTTFTFSWSTGPVFLTFPINLLCPPSLSLSRLFAPNLIFWLCKGKDDIQAGGRWQVAEIGRNDNISKMWKSSKILPINNIKFRQIYRDDDHDHQEKVKSEILGSLQ